MLLDMHMNAKIADFGTSVRLSNPNATVVGEVNEFIGTVAYMAPEVITVSCMPMWHYFCSRLCMQRQQKEGHGRKADIWSLACIVIEMATGHRPYGERCDDSWQFIYQVGSGIIPRFVWTCVLEKRMHQLLQPAAPRIAGRGRHVRGQSLSGPMLPA